ncbi:MAG: UDP-N-acetylmuramate-L-alanine ligase [Candidatus Daviesbacteria bacterium GW2011_GWA2_38_24]|uniref:UDP-N-acetylmuramate--L-alanine ligase n=1 Tax=Candidatus Daviesbacteria bacterium GW2011_GWA2_38_24 TaxID=1618422 RepID=A0A0G0JFF9_9BACT|nr:MAG: UDP-N-acetylmuramate-L-alanine ligase [Candidatus Daviesbacteria bacterium GW2011_GWA2_38_24]OGE24378.1 MAG: UDP-N-acetylmuramate--L-alanine ligase [Candidatus Daviesbacteria bacterium RIFCSPHIGHO2_01_FULL_38_8]
MPAKHVHFLGIGGSGASAVASIAKAQGFKITGCDKQPHNEFTTNFEKQELLEGHSPDHLENVDILAVTPAIFSADPNNQEVKAAKERNIPVISWQEFMGKYLEEGKYVIAVSGTHGKSTTTAMIGQLLEDADLDPTVELGAVVPRWGRNYRIGKSKYFITEADEFNDNFLVSRPDIAVVTSIEMDHPEYFKDFDEYKNSFRKFLTQTKEAIVANLNYPAVGEVLKDVMKETSVISIDYSKSEFHLNLQIPGKFNLLNAAAAFQVGLLLGIDPELIRNSLQTYSGVGRRQELIGRLHDAPIYSDFAHHPTEIKVTVDTIAQKYPDKKLIVLFQPHMYSRTKALWNDFVKISKEIPAEKTIILDIYKAREYPIEGITSQRLAEEIGDKKVEYMNDEDALKFVRKQATENHVIIFLGAGPIHALAKSLV